MNSLSKDQINKLRLAIEDDPLTKVTDDNLIQARMKELMQRAFFFGEKEQLNFT